MLRRAPSSAPHVTSSYEYLLTCDITTGSNMVLLRNHDIPLPQFLVIRLQLGSSKLVEVLTASIELTSSLKRLSLG